MYYGIDKAINRIYEFIDDNYDGDLNENGEPEGTGTMTYDNGKYTGEWKSGKRNGKGTYTFASGNIYDGDWFNDKRHGLGKVTYADGDFYEGEFKYDLLEEGEGIMHYSDRTKYEGKWKYGKKEGIGIMTTSTGQKRDVYMLNGKESRDNFDRF
jgi:hypothetical protein